MPKGSITRPAVVFKAAASKTPVIPWDSNKVLKLWQKRQPHDGQPLPDIFNSIKEVTETLQEYP